MKIIVGLGNPGKEYEATRHNLGFMLVDKLAADAGVTFSKFSKAQSEVCKLDSSTLLCKPQTFMNKSGLAVRGLLEYYNLFSTSQPLDNLFVVHDDLDLQLGTHKVQLGTGPKAHNGLLSLYEHLGSKEFWHVRIGVDNRGDQRSFISPSEYVLKPFSSEEIPIVTEQIRFSIADIVSRLE